MNQNADLIINTNQWPFLLDHVKLETYKLGVYPTPQHLISLLPLQALNTIIVHIIIMLLIARGTNVLILG